MKRTKSFRHILGLVSALGVVGCASAPPPPKAVAKPVAPRSVDQFEAGKAAFEAGDFKAAIAAYDKQLGKHPSDIRASFARGVALGRLGQWDAAAAAYRGVLEFDSKHRGAILNLGAAYRAQGKMREAIAHYKAALKATPHQSAILNNLSTLYREQKKYKKAIATLRRLLERDQRNIDAYKNLALIYFEQKKLTLALTILDNAAKMATEQKIKDADILVNRGMIFLERKQNGKAMAAFKAAVEIQPGHLLAEYNIGALALAHRDYAQAVRSLGPASKAWPNDFEITSALGFAYQGQQNFEAASAALERALALRVDDNVLYQLMVVWQSANNADKALAYGDQLLKLRGRVCGEEDYEGICGRYNGIKLMKEMAAEAPAEPEAEAPKSTGVEVFSDDESEEMAEVEPVNPEGEESESTEEEASPQEEDGGQGTNGGEPSPDSAPVEGV